MNIEGKGIKDERLAEGAVKSAAETKGPSSSSSSPNANDRVSHHCLQIRRLRADLTAQPKPQPTVIWFHISSSPQQTALPGVGWQDMRSIKNRE